ncbi:uncharacterized protein N0V89_008852 [Didymosphaeria variabile]|uniref:Acid phosphatase-like protein n=1 Tax=Didymosphaeria variabile TaxID=1932322 RepID=A0A9W8XGI2_9PLEO|nr:uncharacterized protein N0V89_008852 [Didymosphaeria variabile]KAJ4350231.1 hypothetical protein N0V89_008852 [Didymosphaeria variabile]
MNGGWVFLIILLIALIGGYGGWVAWSRIRASRLGLPPPSLNPFNRSGGGTSNYPGPAPTGIKGWIDAQIHKFKNRNNRTAYGAYEESSGGYNSARGRGAGHRLDPDEAWDARVGNEAYYEEQELGLHEPPTARSELQSSNPYENRPYGAPSPSFQEPERGRSRNREYDERSDGGLGARQNPFGDENAASLRGVSPRPLDQHVDTSYGGASAQHKKKGSVDNSPTESRRSVFHEEM